MRDDYSRELEYAVEAASAAGEVLRRCFYGAGDADQADKQAEREIHRILSSAFPQFGYRGEELGFVSQPADDARHLWLVDPDDGTEAMKKGFRGSAVSVALLRGGKPVLGVVYAWGFPDSGGDLFAWAEGCEFTRNGRPVVRGDVPRTLLVSQHADENPEANAAAAAGMRYRAVPSIAYRLALVAAGEASAAVSLNGPTGWDYAAGHALLLQAGLDLYDANGRPVRYDETGNSSCLGKCFGGPADVVQRLTGQDWDAVFGRSARASQPYGLCWPERKGKIADAGLLSRAQGCLLGQIAGDSLGSLVEFHDAEDIRQRYPSGVRLLADGGFWNTLAGQPTDDSEMALALARSIVKNGGYSREAAAQAYIWWINSGPFDKGNATTQALRGATSADSAEAQASQTTEANGSLMRVSPIGILGAQAGVGKAAEWARQDARLTHPHPITQEASAVFAETIAYAIRTGAGRDDVFRFARSVAGPETSSLLDAATSNPPADYQTHQGWVRVAFHNAFHQLLHAASLEEGVVNTVMAGGDTDTNAAIAGALLGAVHGRDAISFQWRERVLTCRPMTGAVHPRPEAFWPVDAMELAERLLGIGAGARQTAQTA